MLYVDFSFKKDLYFLLYVKDNFMLIIERDSFTLNATDNKDALKNLLLINNTTKPKFAKKVGVDVSELNEAPDWAINYLADLANLNLIHLGYVMKDTKTDGMLEPINQINKQIEKIKLDKAITALNPIILNKDIVSEQGAIKVAYIANIERLLEDFKDSLENS